MDESGAAAVEYVIIALLIALVVVVNVRSLGDWLRTQFLQVAAVFDAGIGSQQMLAASVPVGQLGAGSHPAGFWINAAAISVPLVLAGVSWWRRG